MSERSPEDELQHWRDELARVLKASPGLPWPVLIEWAEEDNLVAMKAATRAGRAKIVAQEQRLASMEKNAAAWQKGAERGRRDLVSPVDMADAGELLLWAAGSRCLTGEEITEHIRRLRSLRFLAVEAISMTPDMLSNAKKRVTDLHAPVQHMGKTWCSECSVRRSTGPKTEEWVAYIPHPCPTLEALGSTEVRS